MAVTTLQDIINPEVMGDMIDAKITALCKFTPYAKLDTTLQGIPGNTLTVPSWNYIGDAVDFDPELGVDLTTRNLTASSRQFTVKCAAVSVGIYQTAINSGLGDPIGQAESQLAKAIQGKLDNDVLEAAYTSTVLCDKSGNVISYEGLVEANSVFGDEEDGINKVIFIHPEQEATLLKDSMFISADKFEAGVAVRGSIGKVCGCWVKKSRKVTKDTTNGVFLNPIIKLEADSAETEFTESELPALTIFVKKDVQVDHEWLPKAQRHDITASKYYGAALTNESKVVIAKFAITPPEPLVPPTEIV